MIQTVNCDLFKCDANIIAHQVNCQGVMGSGVAKTVRELYPVVFGIYYNRCAGVRKMGRRSSDLLGTNLIINTALVAKNEPPQFIANMFAQDHFGSDSKQYTDYEAFRKCLEDLASFARQNDYSVALPFKIGCVRGGGDWDNVIYPMICDILADIDVKICRLE